MPPGTTDLRRLRFFVELARDLHFGRSAERQHVSQPTLSQQIKRLEDELGVALFVRPAGTVTLTPAGARLLPRAEELLAHAEAFNALAADLAADPDAAAVPERGAGGRSPAGRAYGAPAYGNRRNRMRTAGG
jgi:DNA-binding transcriptional LysR family regulator